MSECPECGSKYLIHNNKEVYCSDCGLVVDEYLIDHGQEWRAFDSDQAAKRVRTGPGMTYRVHDKGLSTPAPKLAMKRLKWANIDSSEKTLAFALTEIDRIASALKLPKDIKEMTSVLYRKAAKKHLLKGHSIEAIVAAALFIVCRQNGIPRTLKEISVVSQVHIKEIRKTYLHHLKRKLNIKLAAADPTCYIPRFCSELGLSGTTSERAIEIIKQNEAIGASGQSPVALAASAIFVASRANESISELEIGKISGITPITVKVNAKKLIGGTD